jgi:tight adherence protein C
VIVILLGALLLAGAAVALIIRALVMPRMRAAEALAHIDGYGYATKAGGDAAAGVRGALDEVANLVGGFLARGAGGVREAELRNALVAAGLYRMTPRKFLGYRLLCTVCVPAAAIWLASASALPAAAVIVGGFFGALVGWTAPMTVVRNRSRRRLAQIDYDLPELIDVLVVTVEAGLGFTGSLQVASERILGPLGDELRLTLQEQRMGLSTSEALRNLLMRAETPAVRSFVRSVVQGETLGVSIGEIMRNLSDEMRKRRRASAEERAQKAPIKILFPLIFLIFPAMFVILLGPAVFQFLEAFGGGG